MRTDTRALPPAEMFHYSARHKVVICTLCQYAVQPDAINRHLKEIHHVFRSARKPYIAYTSNLKLKDPRDVDPPTPGQFPVSHLPVERGWKCASCRYMCTSNKRMENHWPAKHGRKGSKECDWSAALLQTFFRGNMLRYFTNQDSNEARPSAGLAPMTPLQILVVKHRLDSFDSFILEHYTSTTYRSFVLDEDAMGPMWLDIVPSLALDHPFIFHGMMACTALHMAQLDPSKRNDYKVRAYSRQATALPLFRHAFDYPSDDNCHAVIIFGYLLAIYSFAVDTLTADTENSSEPLFIVCEPGSEQDQLILPQWLRFLRSGCTRLGDIWENIDHGPVKALAEGWEAGEVVSQIGDKKLPYLKHLLSVVPTSAWSAEIISIYHKAAAALAESFAYMEDSRQQSQHKFGTWNVLAIWPARLEESYIFLLAGRHPAALILLAYYCVLLKHIDGLWYFKGRPAKLLASIICVLDERWHSCIKYAVTEVIG